MSPITRAVEAVGYIDPLLRFVLSIVVLEVCIHLSDWPFYRMMRMRHRGVLHKLEDKYRRTAMWNRPILNFIFRSDYLKDRRLLGAMWLARIGFVMGWVIFIANIALFAFGRGN